MRKALDTIVLGYLIMCQMDWVSWGQKFQTIRHWRIGKFQIFINTPTFKNGWLVENLYNFNLEILFVFPLNNINHKGKIIGSDSLSHRSKYTHLKQGYFLNLSIKNEKKKFMSTISMSLCMLKNMLEKYHSFFIFNMCKSWC